MSDLTLQVAPQVQATVNPNSALDLLELKEVARDSAKLKQYLSRAKSLGFDVQYPRKFTLDPTSIVLSEKLDTFGFEETNNINPLQSFQKTEASKLYRPKEFNSDNSVEATPIHITWKQQGKILTLKAYNYLAFDPSQSLIASTIIDSSKDRESEKLFNDFITKITGSFDTQIKNIAHRVNQFPKQVISPSSNTFDLQRGVLLSEENRQKITELANKYSIKIQGVRRGHDYETETFTVELNKENVKALKNPLRINGQFKEIILSRDIPKQESAQFSNVKNSTARDQYGNYISHSLNFSNNGEAFYEQININPAFIFDDSGRKSPVQKEWDFDLSVIGNKSADVRGVFTQETLPLLGKIGPYNIYSTAGASTLTTNVVQALNMGQTGLSKIADLADFRPGERFSRILATSSAEEEAGLLFGNPDTVRWNTASLANRFRKHSAIAEHEGYHDLYLFFQKYFSGGELDAFHKRITKEFPKFFLLINEENFLKLFGGHSQHNQEELFTSISIDIGAKNFLKNVNSALLTLNQNEKKLFITELKNLMGILKRGYDAGIAETNRGIKLRQLVIKAQSDLDKL